MKYPRAWHSGAAANLFIVLAIAFLAGALVGLGLSSPWPLVVAALMFGFLLILVTLACPLIGLSLLVFSGCFPGAHVLTLGSFKLTPDALLAIPILTALLGREVGRAWFRAWRPIVPFLLIVVGVLSWLQSGSSGSLPEVGQLASWVVTFYLVRGLCSEFGVERVGSVCLRALALGIAVALLQALWLLTSGADSIRAGRYTIFGYAAGLYAGWGLFIGALAPGVPRTAWRSRALIGASITLVTLAASRIVMLAILAGGAWVLVVRQPRGAQGSRRAAKAMRFLPLLFLVVLLQPARVSNFLRAPAEIVSPEATEDANVRTRYQLWKRASELIPEAPLLGHGPGSATEFARPVVREDPQSDFGNAYLQVWVELGVVGLFVLLSLLAAALRSCLRAGGRSPWPVLVGGLLVQVVVNGLTGTILLGGIGTVVFVLLAMACSFSPKEEAGSGRHSPSHRVEMRR